MDDERVLSAVRKWAGIGASAARDAAGVGEPYLLHVVGGVAPLDLVHGADVVVEGAAVTKHRYGPVGLKGDAKAMAKRHGLRLVVWDFGVQR